MKKIIFLSIFGLAFLISASPALAVGTNGSFETAAVDPGVFMTLSAGDTTISGWSVVSGDVDYIGTYWPGSNGLRSVDLNGFTAGSISQTFNTVVGATYNVTFDLSGNPDTGLGMNPDYLSPSAKVVSVSATGAPSQDYTYNTSTKGNTLSDMKWEPQTYSFIAAAPNTTLAFTSAISGAFGPALDNVNMVGPLVTNKDQCKNEGWKNSTDPKFKNQGDCVSFFQSNENADGNKLKPEVVAQDLPEQDGVYDVAGRPDLKLKVIVHHAKADAKPGRPIPPVPTLSCGMTAIADPDSLAQVGALSWGATLPSTWQYNLNPASVPALIGASNLEKIANNAFSVWQNELAGKVSAQRGPNTSKTKAQLDGKNIVVWGRASASALALSYLWYYPDTKKMAEVDTIMNQQFNWAWSDPATWNPGETCAYSGVYDAQDIMTHEFGHTFGLNDMYDGSFSNNTMYGYGLPTETKKNTLTSGDKTGLTALYQ